MSTFSQARHAAILVALAGFGCSMQVAHAGVVASGDVTPNLPIGYVFGWWIDERDVRVAETAPGEVTLTSVLGGTASARNTNASFGIGAGLTGRLLVEGDRATWDTSDRIDIGFGGNGILDVLQGGVVTSDVAYLGTEIGSSSVVTIDGAGSEWLNENGMVMGGFGSCAIDVLNGGTFESADVFWDSDTMTSIMAQHSGSTSTVRVLGAGSEWVVARGLQIGAGGTGVVEVADGAAFQGTVMLGVSEGSSGALRVTGEASTWSHGWADVGLAGEGVVELLDGVQINPFSTIRLGVEASGVGSMRLVGPVTSMKNVSSKVVVGGRGVGSFEIQDGAQMEVSVSQLNGDAFIIGQYADASGELVVDGADSSVKVLRGTARTGLSGHGTWRVSNGAFVESDGCDIGIGAMGVGAVTVTGAGSEWLTRKAMRVAEAGEGTLTIADGARVWMTDYFATCDIALDPGSVGEIVIDGPGSQFETVTLEAGGHGEGRVTITNGGSMITQEAEVGYYVDGTGIISVRGNGSTWLNQSGVYISVFGSGEIEVLDGGLVHIGHGVHMGSARGSTSSLRIEGPGSEIEVESSVHVGPGGDQSELVLRDGGRLSTEAGLSLAGRDATTLLIELGSLDDVPISVTTGAYLECVLDVQLAPGFEMAWGDQVTLIQNSGVMNGAFEGIEEGDAVLTYGHTKLVLSYEGGDGSDVVLTALRHLDCPCDWNASGSLNDDDFFAFLGAFFSGAHADFNESGTTNDDDFFGFLGCFFNAPSVCD